MRRISVKRAVELAEYKIRLQNLLEVSDNLTDFSKVRVEDCHHIDGREGKKVYDVFNMYLCTRAEHDYEGAHHNFERIQELKAKVRAIRLKQGFEEPKS